MYIYKDILSHDHKYSNPCYHDPGGGRCINTFACIAFPMCRTDAASQTTPTSTTAILPSTTSPDAMTSCTTPVTISWNRGIGWRPRESSTDPRLKPVAEEPEGVTSKRECEPSRIATRWLVINRKSNACLVDSEHLRRTIQGHTTNLRSP